jgi:hypothetical protein
MGRDDARRWWRRDVIGELTARGVSADAGAPRLAG